MRDRFSKTKQMALFLARSDFIKLGLNNGLGNIVFSLSNFTIMLSKAVIVYHVQFKLLIQSVKVDLRSS